MATTFLAQYRHMRNMYIKPIPLVQKSRYLNLTLRSSSHYILLLINVYVNFRF